MSPYGGGMLDDGTYDVFVVDSKGVGPGDALGLELTVLAGDHKGEMVAMRVEGLGLDEVDVLGLPGTLVVHQGQPTVTLET